MSVVFFTKDLLFSPRVTSVATQRSIELSDLSDAEDLAKTLPVKQFVGDFIASREP